MNDAMPAPVVRWSELFARARVAPGAVTLDVTADWLQGRTVFGGMQAAIALAAMRTLVESLPLRTLQGTFFAPVPGGPVTAQAKVLRTGKSATHVEARIASQNGDGDTTLALLVGVFGSGRPSAVKVEPRRFGLPESGKPIVFPYVPGVMPAFTQHFAVQWRRGLPPYTGDTTTEHLLDIGMRDAGPATEGHVLALADFIPPLALSFLKAPAPGSTMTWMLEFLRERYDDLPLDGWRIEATLTSARDGYSGQTVMLWGPDGKAVATSRQSMVVFG